MHKYYQKAKYGFVDKVKDYLKDKVKEKAKTG